MKHNPDGAIVCIVELGYVGMHLTEAFSHSIRFIGFDTDNKK